MGTLSKTTIVDYCLTLADQGKKLPFSFPSAANKRRFAVSVFSLQQTNGSHRFLLVPFSICRILETWRHGHGDMDIET
jgi:hypothetical protein